MKRGPIVPTLSAFARFALALLASTLWGALTASAADFGTAVEARSLLERAVAALRADTAAALAKFNRGDDGLRDRDLYVFCVNASDARTTAHADPQIIGRDVREFKDPTGKAFGEEIYTTAREGRITSVNYSFPRPGSTTPVAKESYVTRVGGQICGVGYYK
jgi:signal transduction histidine kinase